MVWWGKPGFSSSDSAKKNLERKRLGFESKRVRLSEEASNLYKKANLTISLLRGGFSLVEKEGSQLVFLNRNAQNTIFEGCHKAHREQPYLSDADLLNAVYLVAVLRLQNGIGLEKLVAEEYKSSRDFVTLVGDFLELR